MLIKRVPVLLLGFVILAALLSGCQAKKEEIKPTAPSNEVGPHGPQRIPMGARPPGSAGVH